MTSAPIPVCIAGPTGYTGLELLEIIRRHPTLRAAYLASARTPAPAIDEEFPRLKRRLGDEAAPSACRPIDHDAIARECRLAFLCLPHDAAMEHAPALLARGVKVVDFSAAYRIKDASVYQHAYGHAHTDPAGLEHAVYGLTEWNRDAVRAARLVANPGCYPTAAAIALIPVLRAGLVKPDTIIVYAASGVSGAGRQPRHNLHFPEANENFSAYNVGVHRHQPEIAHSLARFAALPLPCEPLFIPHLLPVERGILETIVAEPSSPGVGTAAVLHALRQAYEHERFIVVRDDLPSLRDVQRTNMVHVGAQAVGGRVVLVVAEDNLVKGASGQAVQNANLMLGLDETDGLE